MRQAVALDHHLLAGLSGWPVPGPAPFRETFGAVSGRAFAAFLPGWQGVGSGGVGVAGLMGAVERLQGCVVPVGDLEGLVLPARVADFTPELLDEACRSGELLWAGRGPGHVALYLPRDAALLLTPPAAVDLSPTHAAVLAALEERALFFPALVAAVGSRGADVSDRVLRALRELVWAGYVSNDTLAPVRATTPGAQPTRGTPPGATGRWFRLPAPGPDEGRRTAAHADQLLRRYGVVAAGTCANPCPRTTPITLHDALTAHPTARPGHFVAGLMSGRCATDAVQRGHDAGGLGPGPGNDRERRDGCGLGQGRTQFAHRDALMPLRSAPAGQAVLLAATDPANPFGAALSWPTHPAGQESPDQADHPGHRAPGAHPGHPESPGHPAGPSRPGHPGRHSGAMVVLVGGLLVLYAGAEVLWFTDDPGTRGRAARLVRGTSSRAGLLGPSDIGSGAPVTG